MCDLVPSYKEPFGDGGLCPAPPHRSSSRADSHGGHVQAPHPSLAESREVFGNDSEMKDSVVGLCRDTRPVPFCTVFSTIFNTITTFVVSALLGSRRQELPHHTDGRLRQSPKSKHEGSLGN